MVLSAKFQFNKVHLLNDRRIIEIMQSPLVFTLYDIKKCLPFLFRVMEGGIKTLRSIVKRIKK